MLHYCLIWTFVRRHQWCRNEKDTFHRQNLTQKYIKHRKVSDYEFHVENTRFPQLSRKYQRAERLRIVGFGRPAGLLSRPVSAASARKVITSADARFINSMLFGLPMQCQDSSLWNSTLHCHKQPLCFYAVSNVR